MKAGELRIGNLVNTPNQNMNPFVIEEININKIAGQNTVGSCVFWFIKDVSGIPISERYLLSVGFRKTYESNNIKLITKYFILEIDIKNNTFSMINNFNIPAILYIHQLQNMYYNLTGEELTTVDPS